MASKRKRTFGSWADAEAAYTDSQAQQSILYIALRELLAERVRWLDGAGSRRVGLCALAAAHGGVVVTVEGGMLGAYYLDKWVADVERRPAPPTNAAYEGEYDSWLDIRRLASEARAAQSEALGRQVQKV